MHAYLRVRGTTPGPLFIDVTLTPITRATFLRYLNICLQLADIPSKRYNTHSFRIGRATQLAKENCSESIIKTTGRWKSDAFKNTSAHLTSNCLCKHNVQYHSMTREGH